MKALLLEAEKELRVTDVPKPSVGPNDVLVQVQACGICGSDVHGYDGSSGRRLPPLIMGHEAAGIVAEVGENVSLKPGTAVTFDSMISCGNCEFCREGRTNLCSHRMVMGVSCNDFKRDGAFAEYVVVPQHIVFPLPEGFDPAKAAMVEALSVAVHAVDRTPIKLGQTAFVVGAGMIGLLIVQCLKLRGCSQIIVSDMDETRLKLAEQMGATTTLVANESDVVAKVQSLTEGHGSHVTFEAVGADPTVLTAIAATRRGGEVTLVGNVTANTTLPLQSVVTRELTLRGTCGCSGEYPECIALLASGQIQVEPLISAKITLEETPEYFSRLYNREPGLMKVVVEPGR
ncbi:zinc-dependent alcohol dehydrogenase [Calycomorphotria hydatis]|uniref:Sorbitol dehydrogenase n=1 Tax=Calycomorphotria hydatis TaxID=2528027 RepID=A0A517T6Y1_9PLAN|nr:galactitol-1-phosphate 5-dehydrogenase [Calycomorphotria hydatis]QDT64129.1 Sorbitol dehydrogenase [Calycomorphotria hydatis]